MFKNKKLSLFSKLLLHSFSLITVFFYSSIIEAKSQTSFFYDSAWASQFEKEYKDGDWTLADGVALEATFVDRDLNPCGTYLTLKQIQAEAKIDRFTRMHMTVMPFEVGLGARIGALLKFASLGRLPEKNVSNFVIKNLMHREGCLNLKELDNFLQSEYEFSLAALEKYLSEKEFVINHVVSFVGTEEDRKKIRMFDNDGFDNLAKYSFSICELTAQELEIHKLSGLELLWTRYDNQESKSINPTFLNALAWMNDEEVSEPIVLKESSFNGSSELFYLVKKHSGPCLRNSIYSDESVDPDAKDLLKDCMARFKDRFGIKLISSVFI